MTEAANEKLVGTIGIRVSESTGRELDLLVERLEDVNDAADNLINKKLTLDVKTEAVESKIAAVAKSLNKELKDQITGGFRMALDEMRAALRDGDAAFKISFDAAEFSAQFTQTVVSAAHAFSGSIANDLQEAVSQLRKAGASSIAVVAAPSAGTGAAQADQSGNTGAARNNELARAYNQITAAVREEYRLMTQMLRLEGDAYQAADQRLQVVRSQEQAYEDMIRSAASAGQADAKRAADLETLKNSLAAKLDISVYSAGQAGMERDMAELVKQYTRLLEINQRIRLAGDQVSAGLILQRQQTQEAYLAQERVARSYRDTAAGAQAWEDYLSLIVELNDRYTKNTETAELVREQEKLNSLRMREAQLAYQSRGQASEELTLVSRKADAQQQAVNKLAAAASQSEAFLAAQRSGAAQIARELEKQAQAAAKLRDAENQKSESALYSFHTNELQAAYKEILSASAKLWDIQERIKGASSAELPYLRQIEDSLQKRLTLSQEVFKRLKDYPEATKLQTQLTDELNAKQAEFNLKLLQSGKQADSLSRTLEYMAGNLLTDIIRGFARGIQTAFRDAVAYVEEYNGLLTEISIVTGRTQEQAEALGGSYRSLAKEMSVSSKQIAKAAVGYYRQGLDDSQVMERLTKTVQFSKTANLEFSSAEELLTATVNSMGVSIERAADVFNYLGDATATGADEVAIAYSKVGGAARSAGLEFEKVASWIAVISSRTRESAEVIGTSLNSILARYRNIKASGFTENEDGTTTVANDVIKALKAAQIDAIDAATGQLRSYGDILDELAPKWKTLDSNTQAYIGTVMAGTRMQSRFFNLLENYGDSVALYNEALESSGTTSAKYAKWADSVAAAHENMNASLEALYANLMNSEALKAYYNLMAGLADLLGAAIGKLDLWKLSFGLIAAAAVAAMSMMRVSFRQLNGEMIKTMALRIAEWFKTLISSSTKAATAVRALGAAFKASLAFLAVSLVIGAVQAIASAGDTSEQAAKQIEQMNDALGAISDRRTRLDSLEQELQSLSQKAVLSQSDFERLLEIKAELADISPELAAKYDAEGQSLVTLSGLVRDAASAYQELDEEERKAKAGARTAYYNETEKLFADWGTAGKTDYEKARDDLADAQRVYDETVDQYAGYLKRIERFGPETQARIKESEYFQETVQRFEKAIAERSQQLSSAQDAFDAQLIAINRTYQEGAITHMAAVFDGLENANEQRRALAKEAMASAQAYAGKDDAYTEAMLTAYMTGQQAGRSTEFDAFDVSANRYFDLLKSGASSYAELQAAAEAYVTAAKDAFGLDVSGATQKTLAALSAQREAVLGVLANNRNEDWLGLLTAGGVYDSVAAMASISEGLARTQYDAELSGRAIEGLYAILTDGTPEDTLERINDWLMDLRANTADVSAEAHTMSAELSKAMDGASKALAAKPINRMADEGGYRQLAELAQNGKIAELNDGMLIELLSLYPELAALIDETMGQLRSDFDVLAPVIEKARLTYAGYLRSTLEAVTQAKSEMAQGLFDPSKYADLIHSMKEEGYDLLSALGGEGGAAEAQKLLNQFFEVYNGRLEQTAGSIGVVAESWADARRKAAETAAAEKAGFEEQLVSLQAGGSILGWENTDLAEAFQKAYPEIAACMDETGRFAGEAEKLDETLGLIRFEQFEKAGERLTALRDALAHLNSGESAYDALSALPEEYQKKVLPLLGDRLTLEQWITGEISTQQSMQRSAWIAMAGGVQGYEQYIRSAASATSDLTKAIEAAKAALLDQSYTRMEREGAYSQIKQLYDTGRVEAFDTEMFQRLLTLYPELVNMIDHETGVLTADLTALVPVLNKATLAYAASLRDTLDDVTEAKDDMAKGIFDASKYESLIEVMEEYGYDLLSLLGGEDGMDQAMEMMDAFFETYNAYLQDTGSHLGIIAESWEEVQAKAEEARTAAENGYAEQLRQLAETGGLNMDNSGLTQGFLNAYPAIAACIDATGRFRGNVGDLHKEIGKLSFKKFTAAADDIESLQEALIGLRKGKSAISVVSGLAEAYQAELIPALNNRKALEELITQAIGDQAIEQQYALAQMSGNVGSFINFCAAAYPDLYNALAQVYGSDVQNFHTFSQAKAAIDAAVRQAIGNSWDGVYATGVAQMDKAAANLTAAGETAAASRYRAIANAMRAINNVRVNTGGGVRIPKLSGSGGGGGSAGGSGKQQTDADQFLEKLGNADDYEDARRSILQLQQAYHEAKNETQAVLHYMRQEYDLVKELPDAYRENMKQVKAMLDAKKAELAASSTSADNYEALAGDVRNLESAYAEYQKKLLEAETDLVALTQAMEEQRNAVRDTTIEIQDLINQAIEDRNAREQEARDARIDMENEVIAALQKRYDAEKDMEQDALNQRKKALQDEKQALTDALNDRRQLKEEQSKAEQLALMEANYAVISRDTTRAKEAAALYQDIQKLRDEIAEDKLTKQVEEQQRLIDEQISAIEDELAGLDETYANRATPAELAGEVSELLSRTDAEIIEWLKAHNEDFAVSTEATQQSMIDAWQETLNAMNGVQETNWEEVQQIMAGGQEAILAFLREHSEDYRLASKEQAEAYEKEWTAVLDRLKAQMQDFQNTATLNPGQALQPTIIAPGTSSGSSGGSGGSSGSTGGSGGGKKPPASSSSGSSLAALLAGATGVITGAMVGAAVSPVVGGIVGAATSAVAGLIAGGVKPVSTITNTISNLFGGNKKTSSSNSTNNVTVNVNASTVKSTAQTIKQTMRKNGVTMILK